MSTFIIVGLIMCLIPSIITYIIVIKKAKRYDKHYKKYPNVIVLVKDDHTIIKIYSRK